MKFQCSSDWRSFLFVCISFGLMGISLSTSYSPWLDSLLFFLQTFFSFICCIINHNHTHLPTFKNPRWNQVFACMLTLAKGNTSTTVVVPHQLNHHPYVGQAQDWSRPSLAGNGWGGVRILRYLIRASISMSIHRRHPDAPQLSSELKKSLKLELFFLVLFIFLGITYSGYRFFLQIIIPWLLATTMLLSINFIQHDACTFDSKWKNSHNFTGRLFNWFFLNNGFHTVHHLYPSTHWSQLKGLHEKYVDHMPSQFNHSSFVEYAARKYILR